MKKLEILETKDKDAGTGREHEEKKLWKQLMVGVLGSIIGGWILQILNEMINPVMQYYSTRGNEKDYIQLYIDHPWDSTMILLYGILCCFFFYVLVFLLPSLFQRFKRMKIFRVIPFFAGALLIVLFIHLIYPARVGSNALVSGIAKPGKNYEYCLMIQPLKESNSAYCQGPIHPDENGKWESNVQFGGIGHFNIILVAFKDSADMKCQVSGKISMKELSAVQGRVTRRVVRNQ